MIVGAVCSCVLTSSCFEFVLENSNFVRIFRSVVDSQVRLSSKFLETLETYLSRYM
jgi:histone H3/H4